MWCRECVRRLRQKIEWNEFAHNINLSKCRTVRVYIKTMRTESECGSASLLFTRIYWVFFSRFFFQNRHKIKLFRCIGSFLNVTAEKRIIFEVSMAFWHGLLVLNVKNIKLHQSHEITLNRWSFAGVRFMKIEGYKGSIQIRLNCWRNRLQRITNVRNHSVQSVFWKTTIATQKCALNVHSNQNHKCRWAEKNFYKRQYRNLIRLTISLSLSRRISYFAWDAILI